MAKSTFNFREFCGIMIEKCGGMEQFAEYIALGIKNAENKQGQERYIQLATRLLKQAEESRGGMEEMTNDELRDALEGYLLRWLVAMPDEEFHATIAEVKGIRRGPVPAEEAGDRQGEEPAGPEVPDPEESPAG